MNLITIGARFSDGYMISQRSLGIPASACDHDDEIIFEQHDGRDASDLEWIYISTNGDDMFWVDKIRIYFNNGYTFWGSGDDNVTGWCFSTDPNDGDTPHCANSGTVANAIEYFYF